MSKYVEEVLNLAIPDRHVYSNPCLPRDSGQGSATRKFSVFEMQKASQYAADPQSHTAMINTVPSFAPDTLSFKGDGAVSHHYSVQCTCGWRSGLCESINEAFDDQFQKHLRDGDLVESAPPPDSTYVDESDGHLVASYCQTVEGVRYHAPAIDIDFPTSVRESSPGKSHLFIDKQMTQQEYFELLDVMAKVGLVERGYVEASKRRHASYVRMPDMSKTEPPFVTLKKRKKVLEDPSKTLRDALAELADVDEKF